MVIALPSKAYVEVVRVLAPRVAQGVGLLSLTKGVEPDSRRRFSEVLRLELAILRPAVAVLSGPNQAEEVALGQPTATVIASTDLAVRPGAAES